MDFDGIGGEGSAKAVQELAKVGGKALDLAQEAGTVAKAQNFLANVLGAPIEGIVGTLITDPIQYVRTKNLLWYEKRLEEIRQERGQEETVPVSPSVAIPLAQAATNETREEIRELFAQLLAAAMDPERTSYVRLELIDAAKKMAPLDAVVLRMMYENGTTQRNQVELFQGKLGIGYDTVQVSIDSLVRLGLVTTATVGGATLMPIGRELMRIVS